MKDFFGNQLFLKNHCAEEIYEEVKNLPIIDYHCHLDSDKIAQNAKFSDIGELWLSGDHYKWRAMRLCGVDEKYITGNASYQEKFMKYAEILPKIVGNPLYYWTQLELKQVFEISEPLNKETAENIYNRANEKLKNISVLTLFKQYHVEFLATTDDPVDSLKNHGKYDSTLVAPTFRPDKIYCPTDDYLLELEKSADMKIKNLANFLAAIQKRLDYFQKKGCRISDHGFEKFPENYADRQEAEILFDRRHDLTAVEKEKLFGFLLVWLTKEYGKRHMLMQIHFAVIRNNHVESYLKYGADSGFDLIGEEQPIKPIVKFFNQVSDSERPETILYTLNDNNLSAISAITGAFRHVRMGAAWWFNDTVEGIRKNLSTIAEYSCLGTSFGMLTDSRSFSSYARFDFFRRILSDYLGDLVENGEYDLSSAKKIAKDICYYNVKGALGL